MKVERVVLVEGVDDARHLGGLAEEARLARGDRLVGAREGADADGSDGDDAGHGTGGDKR